MSPRIIVSTILVIFQSVLGQNNETTAFLDKVSAAMEAFAKDRPRTMLVSSQIKEMDGDWQAKAVTLVEKMITRHDSTQDVEIIKAVRKENGKEEDVTAEQQKRQQKNRGNISFTSDELFPFAAAERDKYNFEFRADTTINGQPVRVLRVTAKERSEKIFNGNYYIAPNSHAVVALSVSPSKLPQLVKTLKMRMNFDLDNGGHFVIKDFWMRMYANLLVKKIRLEVLEEYKEHTFGAT